MAIKYKINRDLLNQRIIKFYGRESKFIKALGISRQAWNYKLNADSVSITSLIEISNLLDISTYQFRDYFLEKVE